VTILKDVEECGQVAQTTSFSRLGLSCSDVLNSQSFDSIGIGCYEAKTICREFLDVDRSQVATQFNRESLVAAGEDLEILQHIMNREVVEYLVEDLCGERD
jgi:hypothetical protein